MTRNHVPTIDIPLTLYTQFKAILEAKASHAMAEQVEWMVGLYVESRGNLPVVQYTVNRAPVPDIYGYYYTTWIAYTSMRKAMGAINT